MEICDKYTANWDDGKEELVKHHKNKDYHTDEINQQNNYLNQA